MTSVIFVGKNLGRSTGVRQTRKWVKSTSGQRTISTGWNSTNSTNTTLAPDPSWRKHTRPTSRTTWAQNELLKNVLRTRRRPLRSALRRHDQPVQCRSCRNVPKVQNRSFHNDRKNNIRMSECVLPCLSLLYITAVFVRIILFVKFESTLCDNCIINVYSYNACFIFTFFSAL